MARRAAPFESDRPLRSDPIHQIASAGGGDGGGPRARLVRPGSARTRRVRCTERRIIGTPTDGGGPRRAGTDVRRSIDRDGSARPAAAFRLTPLFEGD